MSKPIMLFGQDFTPIVLDREAKWAKMAEELKAEGIERIELWGDNAPEHPAHNGFKAGLWILPVHSGAPRGTFIVCAGGGFLFKSSNEAKPVAEYFHNKGFNAAILDYSVFASSEDTSVSGGEGVRLNAGLDALQAIRYLRANAETLGIRPDKIAIGGFSAGGMTSQIAATRFDYGDPEDDDPLMQVSSRPDAALLLYGAFTNTANVGMTGFNMERQNMVAKYDPLRNIRWDCPPTFIFQTNSDDTRCALLWGMELMNRGIPYELHIFNEGPHGAALYDGKDPDSPLFKHTSTWAGLAAEWLEEQGF